jgi:hypothetical protein
MGVATHTVAVALEERTTGRAMRGRDDRRHPPPPAAGG